MLKTASLFIQTSKQQKGLKDVKTPKFLTDLEKDTSPSEESVQDDQDERRMLDLSAGEIHCFCRSPAKLFSSSKGEYFACSKEKCKFFRWKDVVVAARQRDLATLEEGERFIQEQEQMLHDFKEKMNAIKNSPSNQRGEVAENNSRSSKLRFVPPITETHQNLPPHYQIINLTGEGDEDDEEELLGPSWKNSRIRERDEKRSKMSISNLL